MKRSELTAYLDTWLETSSFASMDPSLNGLVVGGKDREVRSLAVAVDACQATFRKAIEIGADMLVVHHGLYWGHPVPIVGAFYQRIDLLLRHGLDLYAAHLPLDAHPEVGNNAVMARLLGIGNPEPFAEFRGRKLGFMGRLDHPCSAAEIAKTLDFDSATILPFGPERIEKVGIVSGSASDDVHAALAEHLDCFVTGVCDHEIYHECEEQGITVIAGGHYASEVFGVQALAEHLKRRYGLETSFIPSPTGL